MLRSAATVLLASAPLFAAAPAQAAAQQQDFPCAVGLQKVDSAATSAITVSIYCHETQTVDVTITANGVELANLRRTVQADVQQVATLTVPKVAQACATLVANGQTGTVCVPAAVRLPAPA
ncbi:hypothetical protein PV396_22740 [Streptomyces sp. ME02-8801-2C]|uniref:hypothetical protein n=1 Tax=Streptomyces sp. ME02-8801-2C TaxID=3028680 RepID=UPI0029B40035|nr:hypothetical protein [Streptomyces sp. ME02-8801-2C]MDX3454725.1 hypothetical protein [Streptomyces sp. ME02-8801-2C]